MKAKCNPVVGVAAVGCVFGDAGFGTTIWTAVSMGAVPMPILTLRRSNFIVAITISEGGRVNGA